MEIQIFNDSEPIGGVKVALTTYEMSENYNIFKLIFMNGNRSGFS